MLFIWIKYIISNYINLNIQYYKYPLLWLRLIALTIRLCVCQHSSFFDSFYSKTCPTFYIFPLNSLETFSWNLVLSAIIILNFKYLKLRIYIILTNSEAWFLFKIGHSSKNSATVEALLLRLVSYVIDQCSRTDIHGSS